jgi:hypothetical protein
MRIRAGLTSPSRVWEQFLLQEGLPFGAVDLSRGVTAQEWSVLIITRRLGSADRESVEAYLRSGGAVLSYAGHLPEGPESAPRRERLEYLVSDGTGPFGSIGLIDLGVEGEVPREANQLKTQQDTFGLFLGIREGSPACILPFDPEQALSDFRAANMSFYAKPDRLPAERVSLVGKGAIRRLLHTALEYLHTTRNLPYVHLWYYPEGRRTVFAFRIDTDFSARTDIDSLYAVARSSGVGMTWFIDVKSHEPWLEHFASMVGQEFGVHCYEHRVQDERAANLANFGRAKRVLEAAGFDPTGFAAPYGIWSPGLASVVRELGFAYSSEFSCAYDTLPLIPAAGPEFHGPPQIPVHPISIGSLRRAGYTPEQMKEYFRAAADQKIVSAEPVFFYHHPTHHSWDVVEFLFRHVLDQGIEPTTLGEFARWWARREVPSHGASLEHDVLTFDPEEVSSLSRTRVFLRVARGGGREALVPPAPRIDLRTIEWDERESYHPPSDLRRMREFDPRRALGDLYTMMMRKLR